MAGAPRYRAVEITIYDVVPYKVWRVVDTTTGRCTVSCPATREAAESIAARWSEGDAALARGRQISQPPPEYFRHEHR